MIYKKSWKYILYKDKSYYCKDLNYYRVKSLKIFKNIRKVPKGELGGYVQGYHNLSQTGNCWVYNGAIISGHAKVFGNAWVTDNARVFENAQVFGSALVTDRTSVFGNAQVSGNALVCDRAKICDAIVKGNMIVTDEDDI